ncbi:MAG TPA: hypothetical protein VFQ88_12320 [Nevskiaceae bacterium]|nr:hypothetical protein [Nevskiaceae bacterium]
MRSCLCLKSVFTSLRAYVLVVPWLAIGAGVGYAAWRSPIAIVLVLALPLVMAYGRTRLDSFALMLGYFAVGSAQLPTVVHTFFGNGVPWIAYGMPALLACLLAAPFLLVSPRSPPLRRALWLLLALAILTLPPLGLLAWRDPLFAAGALFPNLGWGSVVACALLFCALVALRDARSAAGSGAALLRVVPVVLLLAVAGVCISVPQNRGAWRTVDWIGTDTTFLPARTPATQTARTRHIASLIQQANTLPWLRVLVFPEAVIDPYRVVDEIDLFDASDEAARLHKAIVFGAMLRVGRDGWRDVAMGAGTLAGPGGAPRVLTESRVPMPVGNWHLGFPGGVPLHAFATDAGEINGVPVAWSICYEDFLLWPHPSLLDGHADVLISMANDWSTTGTRLARSQAISVYLLSRMAGVPLVAAQNLSPR